MPRYNPAVIEPKWQAFWQERKTFAAPRMPGGPKLYVLDMFPYPSGDGLHVGHPEGYTATDIVCRFERMNGKSVLHPMGWDAFGLPAEQYAIETGTHPRITTQKNIDTFRRQIKSLGFSYDWDREVDTTDPAYFKWTQWIFLVLFDTWFDPAQRKGRPIKDLPIPAEVQKHGPDAVRRYQDGKRLAYQAEVAVNWCPELGTVLANEEVVDGKSERGGHPVVRMPLRQWLLRITDYAERLLDDLDKVDWSESIKLMQRNWIGKSEGAEVDFALKNSLPPGGGGLGRGGSAAVRVFTTRPDTLFGATYMVLAPEHPLVDAITTPLQKKAVDAYKAAAARKSDLERTELTKRKSGVFTGAYAVNPVNNAEIPIWIADYVLISYGTGAIMAVPAHDSRDFAFATKYGLEIRRVITGPDGATGPMAEAYDSKEEGQLVNSGPFDGTPVDGAAVLVTAWLEANNLGHAAVNYRLRDWLISRQRMWGTPIPIIYCPNCGTVPVPYEDLPVLLPDDAEFRPSGESPLKYHAGFRNVKCPECGGDAERETDTMDTFMCSSWYQYAYVSPYWKSGQPLAADDMPWDKEAGQYWLPVDQYTGGIEHATMHLLYTRFFTKALRDLGVVDFDEPMLRLFNQGMILGPDGEKMSKSRGNVINPDEFVDKYGADTVRGYLMFIGPWDMGGPWDMNAIEGVHRFLHRVWSVVVDDPQMANPVLDPNVAPDPQAVRNLERKLHQTIIKVSDDMANFRFNTAIAGLMELNNTLIKAKESTLVNSGVWNQAIRNLILMMAPIFPHIADELWHREGNTSSVHMQRWPEADPDKARVDEVTIVVQINGKVRDKLVMAPGASKEELEQAALALDSVQKWLAGKSLQRAVVVPDKLVNIVAG